MIRKSLQDFLDLKYVIVDHNCNILYQGSSNQTTIFEICLNLIISEMYEDFKIINLENLYFEKDIHRALVKCEDGFLNFYMVEIRELDIVKKYINASK